MRRVPAQTHAHNQGKQETGGHGQRRRHILTPALPPPDGLPAKLARSAQGRCRRRDNLPQFRFPALGFQKRQGTATPSVGLVLQLQEQRAAVGLAQFPIDQQIDLALRDCRVDVLVKNAHGLTSITSKLANSARSRNRARCRRASIALSVMPRRPANWR